ncbi:nodulation protein NfeD [Clostridium sp. D2Q-11]|uniref:Nodulation protein NfeD n=1 Tax=Anaeromonas frigoriresistens TaxID=2683708 RepID=A0A942US37_9FIRM|nr:NfeD family protein [Anaeromonas frigoriresistens]MBS4536895.1 nodulation protein NfeD [Anaeromonas frigoriresistens]
MKLKRLFIIISIIFLLIFNSMIIFAQTNEDVFVIPIKGEIDKATYQFVKRELKNIEDLNPKAIIFEIDTYGGYITEAEKIKRLIVELDVPTISFVNTKAESAGVLLTIASDKVVMAKGSTIGSAEPIPNTEKTLSYWVEELRSTAITKGRDPELIASMADKSIEIEGIVKEGRLLNLNYEKAKELNLADIIANDYEELLADLNIDYDEIRTSEMDFITRIAKFIVNPYVLSLLLIIGFLAIVVEIFTLGFGAGGSVAIIAFALYFGSNLLVGNTGWAALLIFIVGIILLLIEAIAPGFGVPGIGGIACIGVGIVLASPDIEIAIISVVIAIVVSILVAYLFIKYGQKSPYFDKIILNTKQEGNSGYSSAIDNRKYLYKEGIALTTLRPSGTIVVEDDRLDAVTEGQFIVKGERIKVIKIEGSKVVVRKIEL